MFDIHVIYRTNIKCLFRTPTVRNKSLYVYITTILPGMLCSTHIIYMYREKNLRNKTNPLPPAKLDGFENIPVKEG